MRARQLLVAVSGLVAAACSSPTAPSVVALRSVTYIRVLPVTQAGAVPVGLHYEYPTARCAGMNTPDCQSSSSVRQGIHGLTQTDATSFTDPYASLFADVPVDTNVTMQVSDPAVEPTFYVAQQIYVNGTPIHVQRIGTTEVGHFRIRSDGTVY